MSKVVIEFPDRFIFSTQIDVRISEINYGNHLGNDSILSIVQETRIRFFRKLGFESEILIYPIGIILTDAAVEFKGESVWGDRLNINIGINNITKLGLDMFYEIENIGTGKLVAKVKTGILFFNYDKKKIARIPNQFIMQYDDYLKKYLS